MPDYTYQALQLIQQPGAPAFYITSAPAAELLAWCDVPRAKGDFMAGYQRFLNDKRVEDLAEYLRMDPSNIVPGTVIIAVDSDYIDVTDADPIFSLTVREDTRTFEDKLQELWGHFTTRLSGDELTSADIHFTTSTNDEAPAQDEEEDENEGEDEEHEERDEEQEEQDEEEEEAAYPTSYLAQIAKELTGAVTDWDRVPAARQQAIRGYIEGVSKPGLIIDGQHRVFGAKNVSEFDVRLPVVILPGLAFAEQVFQFYVLNSKARPLKPTELRRIISTSLTNAEIDQLYARFLAAGIEAEEARWTHEVNTDPASPFRMRIDFGYEEPGAVIPENVADQVVRAFMKMPLGKYRQLIDPLGDRWTDAANRLELFFWFWAAIKEVYATAWARAEAAADEGRKPQLFMKVALLTLQTFLLNRFVTALPYRNPADPPPLSSQDEVRNMVKSTLTNLPEDFFEKEWKLKQIDTTEGRKQLEQFMEAVWNNQGKVHGNLRLFQG
jgi:hypothetical protein